MSTVLLPEKTDPLTDEPDEVAHYVDKAKSTEGYVFGTPVTALCGYTWVPSKDPKGKPVCPECEEIMEQIRNLSRN